MAASRPFIDPDEDIAALLERAHVSAPVSDKVVPQLLAQDVGNVAALLEAVAEDGLEGLGLGKVVQRQLCRCLPALGSCDAAATALSSFASLSPVGPPLGAAAGGQAGSSAMAGGDGAAGERWRRRRYGRRRGCRACHRRACDCRSRAKWPPRRRWDALR